MGLLPRSTQLAPRNPGVEAWKDLSGNERRLAARLQEAFAGFLEHTDAQIGRLVAALERLGELDNTLILLLSDNGASQEGGPFGVLNELKYFNFVLEDPDEAVEHLGDIGGPRSHTNYPWGWAQAGNTPFKWYKQNTHEGGVHVPLVVHWPQRIPQGGGVRDQFHHVNDVAPTIYEALGVVPPSSYRGRAQMPVTGTSMLYTLDAPTASSTKSVQYFEMMGHRAIYKDGWKAVTRHRPGARFDDDRWELYHLDDDRSECVDLASAMPEKVAELVALWWEEADRHGVLPLDDRTIELFRPRRGQWAPHRPDERYTYYPPLSPLPASVAAAIGGRSFDLRAAVERRAGDGGVIYSTGSASSGMSLFVQEERLVLDYNCFGEHLLVESDIAVPEGPSTLGIRFRRLGVEELGTDGLGTEGQATLVVDGSDCGTLRIPFVMRIISSLGPSVGADHGSPVSNRYAGSFPFRGVIHRVDIELLPTRGSTSSEEARAIVGRQ